MSYFNDGKVGATYTFDKRPGQGHVTALRMDADGSVWAATG